MPRSSALSTCHCTGTKEVHTGSFDGNTGCAIPQHQLVVLTSQDELPVYAHLVLSQSKERRYDYGKGVLPCKWG